MINCEVSLFVQLYVKHQDLHNNRISLDICSDCKLHKFVPPDLNSIYIGRSSLTNEKDHNYFLNRFVDEYFDG